MATKPEQGGASALPTFNLADTVGHKVVRLPTAAPRKVQQRYNRHTRPAMRDLRKQWRGKHIFPGIREALRKVEELRSLPPTEAATFAKNIVFAPDRGIRAKLVRTIRVGIAAGDTFSVEVQDILTRTTGQTVGEQNDFLQAMDLLHGEEG